MAHLRTIQTLMCNGDVCGKPATVELRTYRNEHYGNYCATCGARLLKAVQAEEERLT